MTSATNMTSENTVTLLVASLTVNCHVALTFVVTFVLQALLRRKRSRVNQLPKASRPTELQSQLEKILTKNTHQFAFILVDSVLSLGLFAASLYVLTCGRVVSGQLFDPVGGLSLSPWLPRTLCAVAVGRLCVAAVFGAVRGAQFTSTSRFWSSLSCMVAFEQLISLVFLIPIAFFDVGNVLTGSLVLIMGVDTDLYALNALLSPLECSSSGRAGALGTLHRRLKTLQCFLSIAFRGIVPLICVVVALIFVQDSSEPAAVSKWIAFLAPAIFYAVYNPCVIYFGAKVLWQAFGSGGDQSTTASNCGGTRSRGGKCSAMWPYFIINKDADSVANNNKVPLSFDIMSETLSRGPGRAAPVRPFTDLAALVDSDLPPPYQATCPREAATTATATGARRSTGSRGQGPSGFQNTRLHIPGAHPTSSSVRSSSAGGQSRPDQPRSRTPATNCDSHMEQKHLLLPPVAGRKQKSRALRLQLATVPALGPLHAIPEDSESVTSRSSRQ